MTNASATAKNKQVVDQFNTILFAADGNRTMFFAPQKNPSEGMNSALAVLAVLVDKPDDESLIAAIPELWELSEERVKLLGKLYLSLDQSSLDDLISIATEAFRRQSRYARFTPYLFTFLAKYYDMDAALNCVVGSDAIDEIGLDILHAISNLLKYDSGFPSDAHIDRIAAEFSQIKSIFELKRKKAIATNSSRIMYDRIQALFSRIIAQAQEIKYRRLKEHLLNDVNLEINQDREILTAGLVKFGFGKELLGSLDHAESEYRKAESKFDFKTAVDHNRSFLEALLWETASKVAMIRNERLTAQQKFPVEVRQYLLTAGFFSERFHKLYEAFYQFASEQSTHKLASGREIARVVRNMNIELGLVIIKRLESFS